MTLTELASHEVGLTMKNAPEGVRPSSVSDMEVIVRSIPLSLRGMSLMTLMRP